ncbi:GNAT family N-acetyltransferase [Hymenobacter caeli]
MLHLTRATADNADFRALVRLLDQDLQVRDGPAHAFYAPLNQAAMAQVKHAVVAYRHDQPVGCGAFKEFAGQQVEIKRMYVRPASRGQGVAQAVLAELERWARELPCAGCVLETGLNQPEAIGLYQKCGYQRIPNYGQYAGVANSVCLQKDAG